jgi:hypothetical protein
MEKGNITTYEETAKRDHAPRATAEKDDFQGVRFRA